MSATVVRIPLIDILDLMNGSHRTEPVYQHVEMNRVRGTTKGYINHLNEVNPATIREQINGPWEAAEMPIKNVMSWRKALHTFRKEYGSILVNDLDSAASRMPDAHLTVPMDVQAKLRKLFDEWAQVFRNDFMTTYKLPVPSLAMFVSHMTGLPYMLCTHDVWGLYFRILMAHNRSLEGAHYTVLEAMFVYKLTYADHVSQYMIAMRDTAHKHYAEDVRKATVEKLQKDAEDYLKAQARKNNFEQAALAFATDMKSATITLSHSRWLPDAESIRTLKHVLDKYMPYLRDWSEGRPEPHQDVNLQIFADVFIKSCMGFKVYEGICDHAAWRYYMKYFTDDEGYIKDGAYKALASFSLCKPVSKVTAEDTRRIQARMCMTSYDPCAVG